MKIRACETADRKGGFGVCITRSAIAVELTMAPPEHCVVPASSSACLGGLWLTLVPKSWTGTVTQPIQGGRFVSLSFGLLTLLFGAGMKHADSFSFLK